MQTDIFTIGFVLILAGFLLVALSTLKGSGGKTETAIVGFIGPMPIGFGTGKNALYVGIILLAIMAVLIYLSGLRG